MADHLGLYCIVAFLVQFLFSFVKGNVWIRLIPMLGIIGCMILSMMSFFFVGEAYFLLYYIGWGAVLFSSGAAWIAYALVNLFKNAKKDL